MKALLIDQHGGIDQVRYGDADKPDVPPGWVRVQTRAAALNHLDLFVIRGIPGIDIKLPHVLGADGAGVVEAVGEQVKSLTVGNRVMLNPLLWCGRCEFCLVGEESQCIDFHLVGESAPGTMAEFFAVPEDNLAIIPEGVSFEQAAAFSLVFQTAWRMLIKRGRLRAAEDVFIHGIGGGVASAALQVAKLAGCRVFVSSSSPEKLESARRLGADFTYNYKEEDVIDAVLRRTARRGVDMVVDDVGAETWKQSLRMVRRGGRIVLCGATSGPMAQTDLRVVFWKQIEIIGSTMSSRGEFLQLVSLLGQGRLVPIVDRTFPLSQGRQALEHLQAQGQFGKVVLKVE